jgi:hypothetical protein
MHHRGIPQIAVDDSRYFRIAQFYLQVCRLNDIQFRFLSRKKSETFVVVVVVIICWSTFEIILFVVGCAISIFVRAVTTLVFGADFVLWIIITRVVLG